MGRTRRGAPLPAHRAAAMRLRIRVLNRSRILHFLIIASFSPAREQKESGG